MEEVRKGKESSVLQKLSREKGERWGEGGGGADGAEQEQGVS